MKRYAVIMAGGSGTRFWPLSRQSTPKQLLNLSGNDVMINETIERISDVIKSEDIFIVTNEKQGDRLKKYVADRIPDHHILLEPSARNTTACIGFAAFEIIKKYGDGIMCVFPADHYIKDQLEFNKTLKRAIHVAEIEDRLVTIGIKPTFPSSGYGYIKYDTVDSRDYFTVNSFKEKPDIKTARSYIDSGKYVWNSGMFVWKASTILNSIKRFLPKVYGCLEFIADSMNTEREKDVIEKIYSSIPSISIDYGVIERSDDLVVVIGEFGWSDVGSWDSLNNIHEVDSDGNIIMGEQININTTNCISYTEKHLIATVGIEDTIIVDTEDAILVCKKDQAQKVKDVIEELQKRSLNRYL